MAAKVTEKKVLQSVMAADPKELIKGKGLESNQRKSSFFDEGSFLHRIFGGPSMEKIESTPAEKAADKKTNTNDPSAEETIAVPKTSIDAACAALEVLKKASQVKS